MLKDYLYKKQFYRFTGPPENWITAIKYMTWGLERKHFSIWSNISPGDIFLMHSMSTNTRLKGILKNIESKIIGFGVVGDMKREKNEFLWIEEKEKRINKWPLLVPFSEIYLFNKFPDIESLPDVKINNMNEIAELIKILFVGAVPLKNIPGFPVMGSFSKVKDEIVNTIFDDSNKLFIIGSGENNDETDYIPSPLLEFEKKEDIFRYGTSLTLLKDINKKIINSGQSFFIRDNTLLERAENAHQDTLERIRTLFRNKGYHVYFNKYVDLFATNSEKSYLFEVKSNENRNFRTQARNGIAKLFEYEYFEIKKFYNDKKLPEIPTFKNLTFSKKPKDNNYTDFLNSLKLGVTYIKNKDLEYTGRSFGINNI